MTVGGGRFKEMQIPAKSNQKTITFAARVEVAQLVRASDS